MIAVYYILYLYLVTQNQPFTIESIHSSPREGNIYGIVLHFINFLLLSEYRFNDRNKVTHVTDPQLNQGMYTSY